MSAASCARGRVVGSRLRVQPPGAGTAVTMTQQDATTCGATSLLAAHLLLGGALPLGQAPGPAGKAGKAGPASWAGRAQHVLTGLSERARQAPEAGGAGPGAELLVALEGAQRELQGRLNRRAAGGGLPLPWTRRLGSTPWAVAEEMTRLMRAARPGMGLVYRFQWVSDRSARWAARVARLRAELEAGAPVLLLVGGPLLRAPEQGVGLGARVGRLVSRAPVVPRHYVLAVPWCLLGQADPGPGQVPVYEPSSGAVSVLDLLSPRDHGAPGPRQLGHWPAVVGLIAPRHR